MSKIIVAGDRSGAGKTTVTMALLAALQRQGQTVQAFKVGPDYIDPMFHRAITGRAAYNLDPLLTSESYVQQCFERHSKTATHAVIEGVMGLFDGAGGTDWASTAHVARLLNCPVLLVVDCSRLSRSLAAIVHGYQTLERRVDVAGVVLNRVGSDRHLAMLAAAMTALSMPVLGMLRRDDAVALPDRHLGLVPTDELADLLERFRHLAALGQRCFDWPALEQLWQQSAACPLGQTAADLPHQTSVFPPHAVAEADIGAAVEFPTRQRQLGSLATLGGPGPSKLVDAGRRAQPVRIGVARDRAFNFYYADNLALLEQCGAELVLFSPLADEQLPLDLDGLLLGGGFPEIFAAALSQNCSMRQAIAQALAAGLPTYGECGGLMYLCETLVDFDGQSWPLVGTIAAAATMTGQLTLGYRQATVLQDSPMMSAGQQLWGHEFHRSAIAGLERSPLYDLTAFPRAGAAPVAQGPEGWATPNLQASYLHTHWGTQPEFAQRFVATCRRFCAVAHQTI
ncbi:MAG: cobyrinate a,c-diamide synthase [Leptolyngbyaceae cyanobacterium]